MGIELRTFVVLFIEAVEKQPGLHDIVLCEETGSPRE